MKNGYLFILILLILSIGAVSAQEVNVFDDNLNSTQNCDLLSSSEYFIDDGNYDNYFDKESGKILDNSSISDGDTIKFGYLNDKDLILDKSLTITSNSSSSRLNNISFYFIEGSDTSSVENLIIINNDAEKSVIHVNNASDISILNCKIDFHGVNDDVYAIYADLVDNFTIETNNITYVGKSNGAVIKLIHSTIYFYENLVSSDTNGIKAKNSKVYMSNNSIDVHDGGLSNSSAAYIEDSTGDLFNNTFTYLGNTNGTYVNSVMSIYDSNITIRENFFYANLVSCPVDEIYNPDTKDFDLYIKSVALYFENCDGLKLFDNIIYFEYSNVSDLEDTILGVYVKDSDDAIITNNSIYGEGHTYVSGLSVIGENFNIENNNVLIRSDENYTIGVSIEGKSSGIVKNNFVQIFSPYIAYGIDSSGDSLENMPTVNYIGNAIRGESHVIFGINLFSSKTIIDKNIIELGGDYTIGISSFVLDDIITVTNNEITVNGLKNDTEDVGDLVLAQTVGIISITESQIHNNIVSSAGNYSILNYAYDSEITNNTLVASILLGDDSVLDASKKATVENNTPIATIYELTNSTFFLFFDDEGNLKDSISEDLLLLFIGEFSNLVDKITLDRPIVLAGDDASLYNIGINILSDNVVICDFNFFVDSLNEVISIKNANSILIYNNTFNVTGVYDCENYVIHVIESYDVVVESIVVDFTVKTFKILNNVAFYAEYSDNLIFSGNYINANLPAYSINWTSRDVYSKGVYLYDCDYSVLDNNTIHVKSHDNKTDHDAVYTLNVRVCDDIIIQNNVFIVDDVPQGYAVVLNGANFTISNNTVFVGSDCEYGCGIDIESKSSGLINYNSIVVDCISAHGIYSYGSDGDVKLNLSDNSITVDAIYAFGMYLSGSKTLVESNVILIIGNFTTGIVSAVDNINIVSNAIVTYENNNGILLDYGDVSIENKGINIVSGDATITDNSIQSSNAKYTVEMDGTGNVTDNYLVASEYTGDASVDYDINNVYVANNTPTMYAAILTGEDHVMYYKDGSRYYVKLTDKFGKPLAGSTVVIRINGVNYTRAIDADGTASIPLGLNSGNYTVTASYSGVNYYSNATVKNTITILSTVSANDIVKIFRNDTQYLAKFVDSKGIPLKNTDVTFNINGVMYTRTTNASGWAKLNINLPPGTYILTAINPLSGEQHATKVTVLPNIVENYDLTKYYKNASQYSLRLLDDKGNPVGAGVSIQLNINGVFYTRTSDENGYVKLNINLPPGTYIVTAEYKGLRVSNTINVLSVLEAKDLVMKYHDGSQFKAKVLDGQGRPYSGQTVTYNINGVFYTKISGGDGIAGLTINLPAGEYIITSMYNGLNVANKVTIIG